MKVFATADFETWEITTLGDAKRRSLEIIKCCQCDRPAKQMDHFWPYMTGKCLCKEHEYDPKFDE